MFEVSDPAGRRNILVAGRLPPGHIAPRMRLVNLDQIGDELALKWDDGVESFIKLEALRRNCPCAGCKGEVDIMGNLYKGPDQPLSPTSFQLRQLGTVGGYGVQPVWADGHNSGIYSYDYLRRLAAHG